MSEQTADFESMTLEELEAFKAGRKAEIDAIHEVARAASAAQKVKVEELHRAEARRQIQRLAEKSGRTLEEEARWWVGRLHGNPPDPGRWIQANLVLGFPGKAVIYGDEGAEE